MTYSTPFKFPAGRGLAAHKVDTNFERITEYLNTYLRDENDQHVVPDGTSASPGIVFDSDTNRNDGLYHTNTFGITGISSGGTSKFQVSGFGAAVASGYLSLQLGSVTAPSLTFSGDTNTGIYSSTADTVNIAAGGLGISQFDSNGINFLNRALIASYASSSNIDHIWHDDADDVWHLCSDTTYKAAGNSNVRADRLSLGDSDNWSSQYLRIEYANDGGTALRINHTLENTTSTKYLCVMAAGANNGNSPGTNDYFFVFAKGNGTWVGSINGTGATGVNYNVTSDARLKTSLEVNPDVGDIVDALTIHKFSWDETGEVEYGVFAQEAKPVYSPPISEGRDETDEDEPAFQPWMADYSRYVGLLLAEVKNLRGRVAQLEAADV